MKTLTITAITILVGTVYYQGSVIYEQNQKFEQLSDDVVDIINKVKNNKCHERGLNI